MNNPEMNQKGYIPADEVARMFGVTKGCLAKWRSGNSGPDYYRIAGRVYYREEDLEAFIERSRVATTSARQDSTREQEDVQ